MAPLPFLSGARVQASRSWQVAVDGATATTADRISLRARIPCWRSRSKPRTRRASQQERAWFTQLRWRVKLGGERPIGINRGALSPGGCTNAATCATRA